MRKSGEQDIFFIDEGMSISPEEREYIPLLLGSAQNAVTAPRQSNFHVKAAAINANGNIVNGGNREYGFSRAYVHGEEAVASKLLSTYPDSPMLGIGFYNEGSEKDDFVISPCGNCRDVLRQEATTDLLITAGNERITLVARLGNFLFNNYETADIGEIFDNENLFKAMSESVKARKRAVTEYLPESMKDQVYGTALIDANGAIFTGSLDTTVGYDAITPGVAAVQAFRNRPQGIPKNLAEIKSVVIVGEDTPDVMYRDRNAISELDETLKSNSENSEAAKVFLISLDANDQPTGLKTTDVATWLPHPFVKATIGLGDVARAQRDNLRANL